MKPLSKTTITNIKLLFNLGFVGFIVFQLINTALYALPDDWFFFITSDAVENLLCGLLAYGFYYFVFRFTSVWKKIGFAILSIALLLFLATLKDVRIHDAIAFEQTFEYFTSFLGQTLLFYGIIYFVNKLEYFNDYKKMEHELKHAKEQLLRNQLHPHFLFNAFNSLYSLSLKNHPETPQYILKLSSMMRYLTDESMLHKVPLVKEIDFIKQYIAIEKMRFGHAAKIDFSIKGTITNDQFIAPFLLITLVENAFKHGFYTNAADAFVMITLALDHKTLSFSVANSVYEKQHFQEKKRTGKGLQNLKQRLQLLYPKKSVLTIDKTKKSYTTTLNIPVD